MTGNEFQIGMAKLRSNYGEKFYTSDREEIIFIEVRGFNAYQWYRMVDEMIGTHRVAPMLKEIRDAATNTREQTYSLEKEEFNQDVDNLIKHEDFKEIVNMTLRKINGEISMDEFHQYLDIVAPKEKVLPSDKDTSNYSDVEGINRQCRYCRGDGRLLATNKANGSIDSFCCSFCNSARTRKMLFDKDGRRFAIWGKEHEERFIPHKQ
jgi:hypothetical protein